MSRWVTGQRKHILKCIVCDSTLTGQEETDGFCDICDSQTHALSPNATKKDIRERNLWSSYELGYHEYRDMFEAQDGMCAICGIQLAKYKNKENIPVACVDHDHKTGEVRGLLCRHCNSMLGFAKDKIENLLAACTYLSKHNEE